ncbi:MAG: prolipoprotein diacylglyceryl transferase [Bacteroidales bacterium]|nr:prolipoprotein diacylglyceryl transferase [Bacteroidales bacterium]
MLQSIVWNVSPILVKLGSIEIRWYGILFALAFIICYYLLRKMFAKDSVSSVYLDKLTVYCFVAVLIGARLGHCLFYDFPYYSKHIIEMLFPVKETAQGWKFSGYQGLASHGGAIGIIIALIIYSRKTKIPFMWVVERLVIAICFGGASIRLGNLMNSEIYGHPTSLPWGFIFVRDGQTVACHPTALYEALSYITIGIVLYTLLNSKKIKINQGMIFGIFLTALFGVRFLLEFLKNNQEAWEDALPIDMGQILSLPFIIAGIVFIVLSSKKNIGKTLDIKLLTDNKKV